MLCTRKKDHWGELPVKPLTKSPGKNTPTNQFPVSKDLLKKNLESSRKKLAAQEASCTRTRKVFRWIVVYP